MNFSSRRQRCYDHRLKELVRTSGDLSVALARISHELATATADASTLTAFRSVGLLDVLHEYDCGGLGRKPCQSGASTVSLRKLMRNAG